MKETGVYQIYCKAMQEDGIGDLYKKYEELKAKLEKEGLFDEEHKKPIPFMPKTIGVLTSKTGSVIKDIINVSTRRNPNVHIKLYPVPVQGPGAEKEIAEAIRVMNEKKLADVLILARGGGSLEDLWPFNEEITARAIYESEIPIISAVGHETDFTIADFVADLRAPTPSAAAELAQADIREIKIKLETYENRYKNALKKKIEYMKLRYNKAMASRVFTAPLQNINEQYLNVDIKIKKLENIIKMKLKESQKRQIELISKLDALSPLKTLTRGYCLAEENGKILKSAKILKANDIINLKFYDGEKNAKIM
ncbi:MAG: exodeoxyribonuclease VII large subunit [Clostridia bacterium]|nr:exodeoxyribonuclease VII large subunit [Clostridia bacterium]